MYTGYSLMKPAYFGSSKDTGNPGKKKAKWKPLPLDEVSLQKTDHRSWAAVAAGKTSQSAPVTIQASTSEKRMLADPKTLEQLYQAIAQGGAQQVKAYRELEKLAKSAGDESQSARYKKAAEECERKHRQQQSQT